MAWSDSCPASVRSGLCKFSAVAKAWRYPCYSITDLQIYDAVAPPPFVAVADNAITYSDKGEGNTLMAGGDLDGDHVFISFWKKLVELVKLTQPSVCRLEPVLKLCVQLMGHASRASGASG
ncbi:unnamed protein product [Symbiodinium necroappetens]|uniref:RNA-dependent RNA polymerase n=1 Tax=Symbiodinium necroappetens TaxID=1628268 RepID=A0A812ZF71_9DINO|nr:unnamed protein product [Symbiodinium necroappetens]